MLRTLVILLILYGNAWSLEAISVKEVTVYRLGKCVGAYEAAMKLSNEMKSKDHVRFMMDKVIEIKTYAITLGDVLKADGKNDDELNKVLRELGYFEIVGMEKVLRDRMFIIENQ